MSFVLFFCSKISSCPINITILKEVCMKNFIVFFFIVMVISFLTPNLFIHDVMAIEPLLVMDELKEKIESTTKNNIVTVDNIKLLLTDNNQIVELSFDDYIKVVMKRNLGLSAKAKFPILVTVEASNIPCVLPLAYTSTVCTASQS